jgi:hypothetical protein
MREGEIRRQPYGIIKVDQGGFEMIIFGKNLGAEEMRHQMIRIPLNNGAKDLQGLGDFSISQQSKGFGFQHGIGGSGRAGEGKFAIAHTGFLMEIHWHSS